MTDQWMSEESPTKETLEDPKLWTIKNILFDQTNLHAFSIQRLVWVYRWLDGSNQDTSLENYQNTDLILDKKMKFLKDVWWKEYFHPFLTTNEAFELISKYKDKYVISLSSTLEGALRISYWRDGVKHHRIHLETYKTKEYSEFIDYDLKKFEFVIDKMIQKYDLFKKKL
jgi:hypothetical protein